MRRWLSRVPKGTPVALEAAYGWPWVADLLEEMGLEPHLGHPPAVKVLASTRPSGTAATATGLASSNSAASCRRAYLATPEVRRFASGPATAWPCRCFAGGVKNRIQAILHRLGDLRLQRSVRQGGPAIFSSGWICRRRRAGLAGISRTVGPHRGPDRAVEAWMASQSEGRRGRSDCWK